MMRMLWKRAWVVGLIGVSLGWSAAFGADKTPGADKVEVVSLADSIEPLKTYFNENQDKLRFVTILSPT
ncbi:MAG: hypothetical protein AABZ47_15155 [Planctomycetota bacterium]